MLGLSCMMNGIEIKDILSKRLGKQFKGVYSKDEVEALQQENRPSAYVFNTRPSSVQFGHWIGIYIQRNGRAVFFDSFGRSPADLGFSNFLDNTPRHGSIIIYQSRIRLQLCAVSMSFAFY